MMKHFLLIFICFSFLTSTIAQQSDTLPIQWKSTIIENKDDQINLTISGRINKQLHVYAKDDADGFFGPVISSADSSIVVSEFKTMNAPVVFADPIFDNQNKNIWKDSLVLSCTIKFNKKPAGFVLHLYAETGDLTQFSTDEQDLKILLDNNAATHQQIPLIKQSSAITPCESIDATAAEPSKKSGWQLFILGFIGGLIALLTPCVFPMIPLTVSFFTKKSPDRKTGIRNASLYGFFILLIYLLLSLPFHFLDAVNPELLNNISTNVYLNVIFFIVFVVFALSFFGLFEITLPASLCHHHVLNFFATCLYSVSPVSALTTFLNLVD